MFELVLTIDAYSVEELIVALSTFMKATIIIFAGTNFEMAHLAGTHLAKFSKFLL